MDTAADALIGRHLGKFRIDAKLGEGGMGAVYQALDTSLDRQVALKVIRPEWAQAPDFVERFKREAKAAGGPAAAPQRHRDLRVQRRDGL